MVCLICANCNQIMQNENAQEYKFFQIQNRILENQHIKGCLFKWGLSDSLKVNKFRYNMEFQSHNSKNFMSSLLSLCEVQTASKVSCKADSKIGYSQKRCSLLNTNFIDCFEESNCIGKDGYLKQIMPIYYGDREISTKILQMIMKVEVEDESELEFMTEFENEFLFCLLKLLLVGGKFNQWDSHVDNYREVVKSIYKEVARLFKEHQERRGLGTRLFGKLVFLHKLG